MNKKSIIIPDQNLEAAIRRAINKPTGSITEEDLWVLQTSNAQVRSEDIVLWIHALTSDNHHIREAATFALRNYLGILSGDGYDAYIPTEVKDPTIVEALLQILNEILNDAAVDEYRIYDYDVVAVLLGAIKEPRAIEPLIQIVKMLEDVSDDYSIPAVYALAEIGTVARTALIQSLKNHDRVVQEKILTALEERLDRL